MGLGSMALATLLRGNDVFGASPGVANPLAPKNPHYAPKAKRVIYLFQAGAPSQLDLFDYKPALVKYDGKPVPAEVVKGQDTLSSGRMPNSSRQSSSSHKHGKSGAELSEMLPHLGEVVDDIAIVKSMTTDAFNHAPASDSHEIGFDTVRSSEHGSVGHIRPR